ncbi:MAG: GNAT family N-acetyltransferase, partial [Opitutae bacterium]
IDWPKARIWAQKFAMEADPPMNLSAITQLAKQMHSEKNLFMLSDPQNHPCAMAGFGRSTDRYRVINMVYVPQDMRRQGIGKELITRMALYAKELRYSACLLFSERKEAGNLYDTMGCKALGKFVEYGLV